MARTAPAVLSAGTNITSELWNDQIQANLAHLLGLLSNGTALTDYASGARISALTLLSSGDLPTGGAGTIINGISQDYTHLMLMVFGQTSNATEAFLLVRAGNGSIVDTGSNYQRVGLGVVSSATSPVVDTSTALTIQCSLSLTGATNRFSTHFGLFVNYTNSKMKNYLYIHQGSLGSANNDQRVTMGGGMWTNTADDLAGIGIYTSAGNFNSGSKYFLYGVG